MEIDQELMTGEDFKNEGGSDLITLEKKISSQLAAYDRLLRATVSRTLSTDWANMGGIPYLMATGAERIARPWGIYIKDVEIIKEDREDDLGSYFIYWAKGIIGSRLLDSELEFMGSCSSRDKFFGTVTKDGKTIIKEICEVDETNIRKKAWTNLFINGVTRILGLRRLSWAFLESCGIKQDQTAKVDYKGKGASETITEAQAKLLYAKMKNKVNDGVSEEIVLEDFKKEFGVDKFANLPKNRMNDAIAFLDGIKV